MLNDQEFFKVILNNFFVIISRTWIIETLSRFPLLSLYLYLTVGFKCLFPSAFFFCQSLGYIFYGFQLHAKMKLVREHRDCKYLILYVIYETELIALCGDPI